MNKGGERDAIYFPQLIGHNGDEVTSGSLCVCVLARVVEMGDK